MKVLFLLLKLIFSLALLWIFATRINLSSTFAILASTSGFKAITLATLCVFLQSFAGGARLVYILKLYGYSVQFLTGLRIWFIGSFFSQVMITFVGGDAMRVWSLSRLQIPIRAAAGAIVLDRVIGFIALIILFLVALPFILNIIEVPILRYNVIVLAGMSFFSIISFILLGALPLKLREKKFFGFLFDLVSNSRYFKNSAKASSMSFLLSFLLQISNGLIIYMLFHLYDAEIFLFECMVLSAPIMLIATLPISFAGWGVRESVMITGFGLLGIPAEKILAVSVTLGTAFLLGALPGIYYFLVERKRDMFLALSDPNGKEFSPVITNVENQSRKD